MAEIVSQEYRLVRLDELEPHPDNPHKGDFEVIGDSIEENGFFGAVLVQKSRMRIIAGHHTLLGAREKGLDEVPAILIDVDDERAKKMLLAKNRAEELGFDDQQLLANALGSLNDLAGTGYSPDDLADIDAALAAEHAAPDPDEGDDENQEDELPEPGDADSKERPAVWGVVVTCGSEGEQVELLDQLAADGHRVRALM